MHHAVSVRAYEISEEEAASLAQLATTNPFFASVYANYQRYGTLTKKQYLSLMREFDDVYRIDGVLVVNRLVRNNRVVCFQCPEFATEVVGRVGVCEMHVEHQQAANREFEARQRAPRAGRKA